MKKLLLVFLVLVLLVTGGLAVFIATFDANKYKSLIETKASEALGSEVKIGSIKLKIGAGLALGIEQLGVHENGKAAPSLAVERASVSLKLLPLLKKSVEVSSIRVERPKITLIKEEESIRVLGINPPKPAADSAAKTDAPKEGAQGAGVDFVIADVKLVEGDVTFRDVTVKPASVIEIKHINVSAENVSLKGPTSFDAKAAIFGERQNVSASGEIANLSTKPELRNFAASADLGLFDFAALEKGVPAVKKAGLRSELAGKIDVRAEKLVVGPKGPETFKADVQMTGGRVGFKAVKPWIENIQLAAQADEQTARLNNLSLQFSDGTVTATGSSQGYLKPSPRSEVDLQVKSVRLDPLVPLTSEGKPIVEGGVSFAFKGSATGAAWPQIRETVNGRADLEFEKGILLNLNIVRELLGKMPMFPGMLQKLENGLPESYKPKLTQQSTILNPLKHSFEIRNGVVLIRGLEAATDFFTATLNADARLSGSLDGEGSVRLDKTFSKAMLEGFPETELLANGVSVELPLIIRYAEGKLTVLPDLKKIVSNLTQGGGKQLIGSLLGGAAAAGAGAGASASGTSGPSGPSGTAQPAANGTPAQNATGTGTTAAQPAASGEAQKPATTEEKVAGWIDKLEDAF